MPATVRADRRNMYFDRQEVIDLIGKDQARVFTRVGGKVRITAKRSIRKARQKTIDELTEQERETFERRKKRNKQRGRKPPRRPLVSSEPGQPPRSILGLLRDNLEFAYDQQAHSLVVGAAKLNRNSHAPETLEHGGSVRIGDRTVKVEARPFMGPAYTVNENAIADIWNNLVR